MPHRQNHIESLRRKCEEVNARIHEEMKHPLPDTLALRRLKEERLHLLEKIDQFETVH